MKRARGRPSINLNKRRLKAAWYYRDRQGWEDPTGRAPLLIPIVRGSFAAVVLRTGGGIVFAATAAGDLGRSRFWIGQAALVFPNRSYDRFFSNKRFGRRKAVCGDCPAAGAQRCTEQVEYFHHPSSPLTAIVAQFKLPLSIVALPRIYRYRWLQPYAKI